MKIQNLNLRFLRLPQKEFGKAKFTGNPVDIDPEISAIIENEGVQFIKTKIQQVLKNSKELKGSHHSSDSGLFSTQVFFDLQEQLFIKIEELLESENKNFSIRIADFKELGVSENFIKSMSHTQLFNLIKSGLFWNNLPPSLKK